MSPYPKSFRPVYGGRPARISETSRRIDWTSRIRIREKPKGTANANHAWLIRRPWVAAPKRREVATDSRDQYSAAAGKKQGHHIPEQVQDRDPPWTAGT